MGHMERNPKRKIHSPTAPSHKPEKAQINDLTSHLKKELEKEQETRSDVSRRKLIVKSRNK